MKITLGDKFYKGQISDNKELLSKEEIEALLAQQSGGGLIEVTETEFIGLISSSQLIPGRWYKMTNGFYKNALYLFALKSNVIANQGYRALPVPIGNFINCRRFANYTISQNQKIVYKNHVFNCLQAQNNAPIALDFLGETSAYQYCWPDSNYYQLMDYDSGYYQERITAITLFYDSTNGFFITEQLDWNNNVIKNTLIYDKMYDVDGKDITRYNSYNYFNYRMWPRDYYAESVNISNHLSGICYNCKFNGLINTVIHYAYNSEGGVIIDNSNLLLNDTKIIGSGVIAYNNSVNVYNSELLSIVNNAYTTIKNKKGNFKIFDNVNQTIQDNIVGISP